MIPIQEQYEGPDRLFKINALQRFHRAFSETCASVKSIEQKAFNAIITRLNEVYVLYTTSSITSRARASGASTITARDNAPINTLSKMSKGDIILRQREVERVIAKTMSEDIGKRLKSIRDIRKLQIIDDKIKGFQEELTKVAISQTEALPTLPKADPSLVKARQVAMSLGKVKLERDLTLYSGIVKSVDEQLQLVSMNLKRKKNRINCKTTKYC